MRKLGLLAIITIIFFSACGKKQADDSPKVLVFASILPQQYFINQIGGDKVEVEVMVQPGKSPATYEPLPHQVMRLSQAAAFFTIGVPFEAAFLSKISETVPELQLIDTAAKIEKRYLEQHIHAESVQHNNHQHHAHASPADSSAGVFDPHVWLSPILVKSQAAIIYQSLSQLDPDNAEYYHQNYADFVQKLQELHQELTEIMAPVAGKTLLVFHPSFGYFTDQYGLKQVAIESGGKEPSAAHLQEIIQQAKARKSKTIITQPEFSQKSAEVIAKAIDGTVLSLNPLAPDYFSNLKKIATTIVDSYK
ncbi:MAG: zinc ABC transporter substrate-binding protein [Candidatus Cloacimonadales bacterium]